MAKKAKRKAKKKADKVSYLDALWNRRFEQLQAFHRLHGHYQVPSGSKRYPSLGNWVQHQRRQRRKGLLSRKRIRRLNEIGFEWESRGRSVELRDSRYWDEKWERMFERLVRFQKRYGHCFVPRGWGRPPQLSAWVARQRRLKQRGELSDERWEKLEQLGLDWRTGETLSPRWEKCYERLLEFKRRFGHVHVPAEWSEDINLGRWVVKTRRLRTQGHLSPDKIRRLDEIGFVWNPLEKRKAEHDVLWSKWLDRLLAFHAKHGHWNVPTNQRRYHHLRVWMDNQRITRRRGRLSRSRVRRLNEVGFPWLSERQQAAANERSSKRSQASKRR